MMRVVNKAFPLVSSEPNVIEIPGGGVQLQVFRYTFQNRTRRYFFWVTATVGVMPSLPSQLNATAWEQDCVLTRLLSGGRDQPLEVDMCLEPEPKRQKGSIMLTSTSSTNVLGTAVEEHAPNESAITASTAPATTYNNGDGVPAGGAGAGWWESGDARRLFAPCTMLYASDCNVKEIVMKRIEVMESVNHSASNW